MVRMPKNKANISSRTRNIFLTKNSRTASFIYWVTTLLTFGIALIIINMFLEKDTIVAGTNLSLALLLLNIILGIVSFVTIFLNNQKNKKNVRLPFYVKNAIYISIGYIFLNSVIFVGAGYKEKINRQNITSVKESVIYISPTPTPEPTSTPSPTTKQVNKINVTPTVGEKITNCHINNECGGGTRELKESECKDLVCCGTNNTYILIKKSECDKIHANTNTTNSNSSVKMASVILPHNGKMVSCPEGSEAKAYNMSNEIKTTLDIISSGSEKILSGFDEYLKVLGCKY